MDFTNWIIIKRALKIFWLTFVAVASFIFAGMLIIQIPQVQTYLAGKVIRTLSERLDGDITIEKVHIKPFTTLVLKNAVIIDKHPAKDPYDSTASQIDTFFRAEYIIAKFSLDGLLNKESLRVRMAYVGNAQMNLVLEDRIMPDDSIDKYDNLSRIFRIEKPETKKTPSPKEIFRIGKVEISDMGFTLTNRGSRKIPHHGGIDWNNLDVKHIDLDARGLRFKDGIMYGKAEQLSFNELSGFICHSMSGDARVGRGKTIVEDLRIKDIWSDISIPLFMMSYTGIKDFNDFIEKVRLDAEISESTLDFKTLAHFAPQIEGNKLKVTLSGLMSGTVENFSVKDTRIVSHAGGFSGTVNGRITGIPKPSKIWIDCKVSNMDLTAEGLGIFISEWMPEGKLDLSDIGKDIPFAAYASAKGYLNSMNVMADMASSYGSIHGNARMDGILKKNVPIRITGNLQTHDLNLGAMTGAKQLGPVSLDAGLSLGLGQEITAIIDSIVIKRLNFKGYDYKEIQGKGNIGPKSLNGTIISKDPNLNFIIQGGYAKSDKSKNAVYKYNASIGYADLNAINLDKRGKSIVQFRSSGNFTRTGKGDMTGRIDAGDIQLENKSGRYSIGDIVLTSHSTASHKSQMHFKSDFAEAVYTGSASFIDFIDDLNNITLKREIPALSSDSTTVWQGNSYSLDFICHNLREVLAFAVPGLYIEDGTSFNARINSSGDMVSSLQSRRIAFRKNYMKGLQVSINNLDNKMSGNISCSEISLATVRMYDNLLQIHADDNLFGAGFSFDNKCEPETKGEFFINGKMTREEDMPVIDIDIKPSALYYDSKEWNIQPSGIRIYNGDIDIDSFGVISGQQTAGLFGKISKNSQDVMTLNLERFDLSIINSLLPSDFGVKGAVSGTAELKSPIDEMELMVDIVCDSSYVANVPLGVVKAGTRWNEGSEGFDIFAWNDLEGNKNIDLRSRFMPKAKRLTGKIHLDRLDIGYAQPFMTDIFSRMTGNISGSMLIDGPLDKISLNCSDGMLEDALLEITYTGVPYTVNGPFHINENGVYFDDISIKDRYRGTGLISGSIDYDHFKDISFNTKIRVNQIEAVNLTEDQSDVFYGNLSASGDLSIKGPLNSIVMDINAITERAGQLHIPMSSSLTSSKETNLLKFKKLDKTDFIDPYEIFVQATDKEKASDSDFIVRLKVNARPDVEAFVEIDKASGNVLSGRGSGNISLEIGEDIFNINGDYTINSGNYRFVAMGLMGRDFNIQDGSSIKFNGDIMESTLDINAVYRTKASISTLISDTTSVANRRIVDCGISIKDKLSNPQLSFSIEIPDLDPTVKSRVESALSTEDKVQKQFLSLIISNNFLPDEQSGIVNNTSVLYSNVTEMMANQINNIFQKLDIPLDLGLNYQPNERGNDIFDVAVSTQLFNNRVIVNGNIGNRQYSSGNTQNEVAGDIDIEIKLDRSGSFRLNLFSHSADQYTNYLDNSQRNGIGIMYQTEFNTFRQFFRNLFSSKKKRIERRRAEEKAAINEEKIKIIIDTPENHNHE